MILRSPVYLRVHKSRQSLLNSLDGSKLEFWKFSSLNSSARR